MISPIERAEEPVRKKEKGVGINLSPEVVDYFKRLAEETGLPYQKLIDLYLLDCARKHKKLTMKWWHSGDDYSSCGECSASSSHESRGRHWFD